MTLSSAQLLIDSGVDWVNYLANDDDNGILGYTFYTSNNSIPDYWYVGNDPINGFKPEYTLIATSGTETYVTDDQQSLIRYYLSDTANIDYRVSFSDVSNISFEEQLSPSSAGELFILNADVHTSGEDTAATAVPPQLFYDTFSGDVFFDNVQYKNLLQNQIGHGEEGAWSILHELGHAVAGLNHPSEVGLTGGESTIKYTAMASLGATHPDMVDTIFPSGLQLYDIAALQTIYGADTTTRVGTTTYKAGQGFNSNTSEAFVYTIWDAGGNDWIDATGYTTGVQIDLREGHFSSIGNSGIIVNPITGATEAVAWDDGSYDSGNVAIAYGAVIENAIGTAENDHLIGNDADNRLEGRNGDDILQAGRGVNEYLPGFGVETLYTSVGTNIFGNSAVSGYDILILDNFINGVDVTTHSYTSVVANEGSASYFTGFEEIRLGTGDDTYQSQQSNSPSSENIQQIIDLGGGNNTYIFGSDAYIKDGVINEDGFIAINADIFNASLQDGEYVYVETLGNQINGQVHDLNVSYAPVSQGLDITFSGGVGGIVTVSDGTLQDNLSDVELIVGSNFGDAVSLVGSARYWTGLGDDIITVSASSTGSRVSKITYGGGDDHVYGSGFLQELRLSPLADETNIGFVETITSTAVFGSSLVHTIDLAITVQGQGSITLHDVTRTILNVGSANETSFVGTGINAIYLWDGRTVNLSDQTFSGTATIAQIGTHGDDDLVNVAHGGGGDDILRWTGTGPVGLYGELGDDTLYGGVSSDTLLGGFGNDTIYGGDHIDKLHGNEGNDTLYGEDGNDVLNGSIGNDILYGGAGDDFGYGGFNNDELYGGAGADLLDGGSGNDIIDGGAGFDHLRGGVGNDVFVFGSGYSTDTIYDFLIGQNTIDLSSEGISSFDELALTAHNTLDSKLTLTDGSILIFKGIALTELSASQFTLVNIVETFGTAGVDVIHGTATDIDIIHGLEGQDYLYGDGGDDTLYGDDGNDRLYGEAGNDTLYGGLGNDYLWGHIGDDILNGDDGADTLRGLEGADTISGGAGDDLIYGDDDLSASGFVDAGDDIIYGDAGNDNISGGDGDDELHGGTENDVIHGDDGADDLYGDAGDDFLYGGVGGDYIDGGDGNDKLYGESGTDVLIGEAGTDTLYGGDDNDILIGGAGTDFLYGQGGADIFALDLTSIDRLSDFDASEGDTINIADLLIGYDSATDDINDFVTLVYRNAARTDIRVNDDGLGTDLPYVGIVFSDLTGETVNTLVASGTLVVE